MSMRPSYCWVCLLPVSGWPVRCGRLVRMTWQRVPTPEGSERRLVVPEAYTGQLPQTVVCERCIRDIKRLPFSAVESAPPVPDTFAIPGPLPGEPPQP